jgi:hypothetical protein
MFPTLNVSYTCTHHRGYSDHRFNVRLNAQAEIDAQLAVTNPGVTTIVVRTLSSDSGGFIWSVTLVGATATLTDFDCIGASGITCLVSTDIVKNLVSGSFRLQLAGVNTPDLSVGISANGLRDAIAANLVLPNVANSRTPFDNARGPIVVTRSSPDAAGGYSWTVTFRAIHGNVDQLVALPSLSGSGADIRVRTDTDGNQLSGSFALRLGAASTLPIQYDATASDVQSALVAMSTASLPAITNTIQVSFDAASVDTEVRPCKADTTLPRIMVLLLLLTLVFYWHAFILAMCTTVFLVTAWSDVVGDVYSSR